MIRLKKLLLFFLLSPCFWQKANSQAAISEELTELLVKLDSLSRDHSISRHFASIYLETTVNAIEFFSKADKRAQVLMEKMQLRFADYFFSSANAYRQGREVAREWKAYYADPHAPPLRYLLYGINAHINGDIWQAMTSAFTAEEIRELKPYYTEYQKGLLKIYRQVYQSALREEMRIQFLHRASFGAGRLYGKWMLKRWRQRQIRLSELYYTDRAAFEARLSKLHQKMERINRLIRKNT